MADYNISPKEGWFPDESNSRIAEYLYKSLTPFVNSGDWNYYNFLSGQGWFEQDDCGSLFVEFMIPDNEEDEIEFIKSLNFSLIKANSNIHQEMLQVSEKYALKWSIADDS